MHGLKSAFLIDFYNNCKKNGFSILLFTHKLDNRFGVGVSSSRLGQRERAIIIEDSTNIFSIFLKMYKKLFHTFYIVVDEVQFLNKSHIDHLVKIATLFPIYILCFGLRSDFLGRSFKGSSYLLTSADKLEKIFSYCFCGNYAVFNMRYDTKKCKIKKKGKKILIGGNELYTQMCRFHSAVFKF